MWSHATPTFGPEVVISPQNDAVYMASTTYFPHSVPPYRIDLNNQCYLALKDGNGVVLWESQFHSKWAEERVEKSFRGYDPDPIP